mmetsp:Transcript_49373/g.112033  ORF Transcript_49373/g.112033 Transcript_49373/m.112033 type:complete len:249 (+) Transcript_49373:564-1310(+)
MLRCSSKWSMTAARISMRASLHPGQLGFFATSAYPWSGHPASSPVSACWSSPASNAMVCRAALCHVSARVSASVSGVGTSPGTVPAGGGALCPASGSTTQETTGMTSSSWGRTSTACTKTVAAGPSGSRFNPDPSAGGSGSSSSPVPTGAGVGSTAATTAAGALPAASAVPTPPAFAILHAVSRAASGSATAGLAASPLRLLWAAMLSASERTPALITTVSEVFPGKVVFVSSTSCSTRAADPVVHTL